MPVISRLVSMILRAGEIAFAGIVVGLVAYYFDKRQSGDGTPLARFIYIMVIACISLLLAILWLLPFAAGFSHYPVDIFLSLAWWAAFGVMIEYMGGAGCNRDFFEEGFNGWNNWCGRWRTVEAFSALSGIFWMVSALVGLWFIHRERRKADRTVVRRGFFHRRQRV